MFGLFKKKTEKAPLPSPVLVMGVNYFNREIELPDDVLESYYQQLRKLKSQYTTDDIESISQQAGFDITKGIDFKEQLSGYKTSISVVYKFIRISKKGTKGIDSSVVTAIQEAYKVNRPLTRMDIQSISQEVGCDTYSRCEWKSITKIEFKNEEDCLIFYMPNF